MLKINILKFSYLPTFLAILILTAMLGRQVLGEDLTNHSAGTEPKQPNALDVGLYSFLTEVADGNKKAQRCQLRRKR